MFDILHFIRYIALQGVDFIILLVLAAGVMFWFLKKLHSWKTAGLLFAFFLVCFSCFVCHPAVHNRSHTRWR